MSTIHTSLFIILTVMKSGSSLDLAFDCDASTVAESSAFMIGSVKGGKCASGSGFSKCYIGSEMEKISLNHVHVVNPDGTKNEDIKSIKFNEKVFTGQPQLNTEIKSYAAKGSEISICADLNDNDNEYMRIQQMDGSYKFLRLDLKAFVLELSDCPSMKLISGPFQ